jgi:hypothetical protein
MSNVIKVDFKGEDEKNGYSTFNKNLIGVVNKATELEMIQGVGGFLIISDNLASIDRKEMAEWLWMAAHMLDSEGRYKFDEYVGLNYPEETNQPVKGQ